MRESIITERSLSETTIVPFQVSMPGAPAVIGMVWFAAPSLTTVIRWVRTSTVATRERAMVKVREMPGPAWRLTLVPGFQ